MAEHLKYVGLEVEGGWDGEKGRRPFSSKLIADHSVDGRTLQSDCPLTCTHVGEVVSSPMPAYNWKEISDWINIHWPQYTNITCGYHIHVSTQNVLDYVKLTKKLFMVGLVERVREKCVELNLPPKHYIYKRMRGDNPFSGFNFDTSNQIRLNRKSVGDRTRYGVLNFSWGLHGTVEFRGYPTFPNKDEAHEFTKLYLDFVDSYLDNSETKFKPISAILQDNCGEITMTINSQEVR